MKAIAIILASIALVAIGYTMCHLIERDGHDNAMHDNAMHVEHKLLHEGHMYINDKVEENNSILKELLKIAKSGDTLRRGEVIFN